MNQRPLPYNQAFIYGLVSILAFTVSENHDWRTVAVNVTNTCVKICDLHLSDFQGQILLLQRRQPREKQAGMW